MIPGRSHLERGVLYRTIGKLIEACPGLQLSGLNSERYRLAAVMESVRVGSVPDADRQELIGLAQFAKELTKEQQDRLAQLTREAAKARQGTGFTLFDVPWRDSILDWQLCALREFERHGGRVHADFIDALQGQARWQWRFTGAKAAEPTFRDAWARTLQLSDRVLPGLPEVQTYGFLETSRVTADLLLSCFCATTRTPVVAPESRVNRETGEAAFVSLFNGRDLAGWRLPGDANPSWRVVDGVLEGSGRPAASSLVTRRTDFANFHLRVETKLAEGLNGGIQFRLTESNGERTTFNAIIGGTSRPENDQDHQTGCLRFSETPGSAITLVTADPVVPIEPGEWFMEEVIADGDVITILVKGTEVARFRILRRKLLSGAIGLLCRANAKVAFRRIEISELGRAGAASTVAGAGKSGKTSESSDSSRTARVGPAGHWQIENDQLVQTTLERDAWIVFGDRNWTDYTFTAEVKLVQSEAHVGLYFRNKGQLRGDNYFFTAGLRDRDGGSICRVAAGKFDVITAGRNQDAVLTPEKWHTMRIDVRGERFTAYLDGRPVFSASDAANPNGCVGLRAWNSICRFRNVKVTNPDGKTLWEGLPELPTSDSIGVVLGRAKGGDSRPFAKAANDRARDAYEVVWSSKGLATRLLVERQQLFQAAKGRPEVGKLVDELQNTRQSLARLSLAIVPDAAVEAHRTRLGDLTRRKEDLERALARVSEPFRRAREVDRASVSDLVRRLPPKTAVVDLVERWQWMPPVSDVPRRLGSNDRPKPSELWARKRYYEAFVVRRAENEPGWSVAWATLGDGDELDRLLGDGMATLRQGRKADPGLPKQLRRTFWEPIEAALGDCQTVILVPDGRLAQVPWNALPGRRPDSYLIEDYALAQAPYGQYVARLLADPAPSGNGFLLVGGIDYGPAGKWPYLKGTAIEVEQLAKLRPGPDTVRLGGQSATQSRLWELMPGRRFIHLATHGEFLDPGPGRDAGAFLITDSSPGGALFDVTARNPLVLSKLVLAGANRPVETHSAGVPVGDDGFLTAEEVMGMDLSQTELVVLSACETGTGKVRGGEGVFSLQRAFHVAGSRAVVASLWAVDDRATQALMDRFYQKLWANPSKPPGKLAALREAQLWLLREGAKQLGPLRGGLVRPEPEPRGTLPPSYWAAFVLSGDWR
jgi:CHAT domain-containing protein